MPARTCVPRDGERSRLVAVAVAAPVRDGVRIHAGGERLGPLGAPQTEPDNPHTLRAVTEMPNQRAESASIGARLRIGARLFVLTLRNQPNAPLMPIVGHQF
jgi:hypothetical protein